MSHDDLCLKAQSTSNCTARTFIAANFKICPRILPANLPLHGICGTASKTLNSSVRAHYTRKYDRKHSHALALASHSLTYYQWQQPRPERHVCASSSSNAIRNVYNKQNRGKRAQHSQILRTITAYHYKIAPLAAPRVD